MMLIVSTSKDSLHLPNNSENDMKKLVLLSLAAITAFGSQAQDCSELFFSEYVEGSHNNKALEIYNPTQAAIDLGSYRVVRWSNGSNTSDQDVRYTQPLSGTIQPLSTFIVALDKQNPNGVGNDTALFGELLTICQTAEAAGNGGFYSPNYESGDVGSRTIYHNGDDAISLQKTDGSNWNNVDIFGVIGEQPIPLSGSAVAGWTDEAPYWDGHGAYWTRDKTLIRKSTVKQGVSANPGTPYSGAFNPSVEYDSLPENTFSNLGMHVCECADVSVSERDAEIGMSIYPNPSVDGIVNITSQKEFTRVSVVNLLGMEIYRKTALNTRRFTLATDGLKPGIYLVQIELENGLVGTRKLTIR